jgi:hypothetical protein
MFNLQSFGVGFVTGFATGLITRELTAVSATALKPIARGIVKSGYMAAHKVRESLALVGEAIEDIAAEVKSEAKSGREKAKVAAAAHKPKKTVEEAHG